MDCNIIKDLIPLYIDRCCSDESKKIIEEHIENCSDCKQLIVDMTSLPDVAPPQNAPKVMSRINDWKASLLQSVLLFLSFAVITVGVALEASTPLGLMNGYWAFNVVIPATAFLLSLSNWYFVRLYKSRKAFSNISCVITILFELCCFKWGVLHYTYGTIFNFHFLITSTIGIFLAIILCVLSKIFSHQYAKMLGKE